MNPLERLHALCLSLPEAFEVEAWGHPTFRVGGGKGKMFAVSGDDPARVSLKADPLERESLLQEGEPFFDPSYFGARGWIGAHLDDERLDWEELAELVGTAYFLVAPKKLAALVDEPPQVPG